MAYIGATQALIESDTHMIIWVGYMWVGCVISGAGRSLRHGSGGKAGTDRGRAGVSTGGQPVPDQ